MTRDQAQQRQIELNGRPHRICLQPCRMCGNRLTHRFTAHWCYMCKCFVATETICDAVWWDYEIDLEMAR
jgi:hypothetical protein